MRRVPIWVNLVLLLLIVLGGFASFRSFEDTQKVPTPLGDGGLIRLYFDRPGVDATFTVDAEQRDALSASTTDYDFNIQVDNLKRVDRVRFYLVLSGSARSEVEFPAGSRLDKIGSCWTSITFVDDVGARCSDDLATLDAIAFAPESREGVQILSGVLRRNDIGFMFTSVFVTARGPIESRAGSRSFIRLPSIGTTYLPESGRDLPIDFGTQEQFFVPRALGIGVEARAIADSERVESISPTPLDPGSHQWVEASASTIEARSSLVNVLDEARAGRSLFFLGIVVSLLATLVLSLIRSALARRGFDVGTSGI